MVPSQNTSCSLGFGASSVPSRDLGVWMLVNVLTSQMAHVSAGLVRTATLCTFQDCGPNSTLIGKNLLIP